MGSTGVVGSKTTNFTMQTGEKLGSKSIIKDNGDMKRLP
jgi:hypothetical protein